MKRLVALLILGMCCTPALAQKCQGLLEAKAIASSALQAVYQALLGSDADCGSIKVIIGRIVSRERTGGRKLEADRPVDPAKAQANLDAALRDPHVAARITQGRKNITDEAALLAYEAAVFDEEGFYGARDLRVQQLQQRVQ